MKIICTVKEFGQLVRGCAAAECWRCPLSVICGEGEKNIEKFIQADNIVDEFSPKRRPDLLDKKLIIGGYQPVDTPERLIPPVGSGGEDG